MKTRNTQIAIMCVLYASSLAGAGAVDFILPANPLRQAAQLEVPPVPAPILAVPPQSPPAPQASRPAPSTRPGFTQPDESLTPGDLCTPQDPNFQEYRYPEQIAYCRRNVSEQTKIQIAKTYSVPWDQHQNYEFDHRIPLCMGGSDSIKNLWPQPLNEAKIKDKLEDSLCLKMKSGTISQQDAVAKMLAWTAQ